MELTEKRQALLQSLRLMDNILLSKCFENNIECTELVLHIVLEKPDLQVTNENTQVFMTNLLNRSVQLDILATDSQGKQYNIEIQRSDSGAIPQRARYNSSMLDANLLPKGDDFSNLPETYVIFITEHDVLKANRPIYRIERYIMDTGNSFNDGSHIIYVNGAWRDDSPLGKLMHDFSCPNPAEMYYKTLAERIRFFKENKKEVSDMNQALEKFWQEAVQEGIQKGMQQGMQKGMQQGMQQGWQQGQRETMEAIAKSMLLLGKYDIEEIAKISGLSIIEIEKIQEQNIKH